MHQKFPGAATNQRLETTEINHLPALETSLRSRRGRAAEIQAGQSCAPSRGSRGGSFILFQLLGLQASLGWWPRPSHLCLCPHMPSPLCVSPLLSLIRTPVIGFRAALIQDELISDPSLVTSAKFLFPNKYTFIGSGG